MKTLFMHCTVLDGTRDMEPLKDMSVVAEDGRITQIFPSSDAKKSGKSKAARK